MSEENVGQQFRQYRPEPKGGYTVFHGYWEHGDPNTPQSNVDIGVDHRGVARFGEARAARTRESMQKRGQATPVDVMHGRNGGGPYIDDGNHRAAIAAEQGMPLKARVFSYNHEPPPGLLPHPSVKPETLALARRVNAERGR